MHFKCTYFSVSWDLKIITQSHGIEIVISWPHGMGLQHFPPPLTSVMSVIGYIDSLGDATILTTVYGLHIAKNGSSWGGVMKKYTRFHAKGMTCKGARGKIYVQDFFSGQSQTSHPQSDILTLVMSVVIATL